jgi:hypothetical protein
MCDYWAIKELPDDWICPSDTEAIDYDEIDQDEE